MLNYIGTEVATDRVIDEGKSFRAFQNLLGAEETLPSLGSVTLNDRERLQGRLKAKMTQPPNSHTGTSYESLIQGCILTLHLVATGVPDILMKTYRKIQTSAGPLYRGGGFYIEAPGGTTSLFQLVQVTTIIIVTAQQQPQPQQQNNQYCSWVETK